MKVVVDTRLFITHFLAENEELRKKTKKILTDLQRPDNVGYVPTIVIHEIYKFEYENVGKDVANMRINSILKSALPITNLNSSIAITAAKLRCKYREIPTADSIVAATSMETKSDYVLTDDPHLSQIEEIKTKWI